MNARNLSCLFFVLMLTISGCNEKDPEPNLDPLLIASFDHYLSDGYVGYLVVTDTSNNVLASAKIETIQTITLIPDKNYTGKSIHAYIINNGDPFHHTTAYLNVKRGSTWDFRGQPIKGTLRDPIKLRLKNTGTFDYLTFGTDAFAYTRSNSWLGDTAGFNTRFNYFEGGKIYAQKVQGGQGKYAFLPIENGKTTYDVDFSTLSSTSLSKKITLPTACDYGNFTLLANPDANSSATYFLHEGAFSGSDFTIFYPDVSFNRYFTMMSFTTDKKSYSYNTYEIRNSYDPITFNAVVSNSAPDKFKAKLTGDFDYYNAEYWDVTNKKFIHVYGTSKLDHFEIPDLSGVVPVEKLNFSEYKLSYLTLVNMDGVADEDEFNYYSTIPLRGYTTRKSVSERFW